MDIGVTGPVTARIASDSRKATVFAAPAVADDNHDNWLADPSNKKRVVRGESRDRVVRKNCRYGGKQ